MLEVTILGCGPSNGVPFIGNKWGECDPAEPRNYRRRASVFVRSPECGILIDTAPDLRAQLLDAEIADFDAILFTHEHADHVMGLDDIRVINWQKDAPLPVYGTAHTLGILARRFDYIFEPHTQGTHKYARPQVEAHEVEPGRAFQVRDLEILPILQDHGRGPSLGFRIGSFAYSTDFVDLDDDALAALAGVKVWVVDCLGYQPHRTHCHLEKTLEFINKVKPERAFLTHMGLAMDYQTLCGRLPDHIRPSYDGLTFSVP